MGHTLLTVRGWSALVRKVSQDLRTTPVSVSGQADGNGPGTPGQAAGQAVCRLQEAAPVRGEGLLPVPAVPAGR